MKITITAMAIALLFAVTANADVIIHETNFEAESATGFGLTAETMGFTDAGGDMSGFTMNNNTVSNGLGVGISDANANSGSFHYAVDAGATTDSGPGWGGSWSGINSTAGGTSGGFGTEADVIAAGVGSYINYTEGATFTVSVMVATDALDPLTGSGTAAPRLEFFNATQTGDLFRNQTDQVDATTIGTGAYTLLTHSYTLTAADEALNLTGVNAVMGTDNMSHDPGVNDGVVYFDDFVFQVSDANVVTLAVPEPATASLMLAGLLGLCGVRRRKN